MAVVKRDELNTLTTASAKAVAAITAGEHHVDGTLWFYDELRLMAGELSLTVAAHTLRHADIYAAQVSPPLRHLLPTAPIADSKNPPVPWGPLTPSAPSKPLPGARARAIPMTVSGHRE